MTSKSKAKGSSWERDIANFLTELYGEINNLVFARLA